MKRFRRIHSRISRLAILAAVLVSGVLIVCGDNADGGGDRASSPGLVAHYYRDSVFWNGHWPDVSSVPDVSPKDWTFSNYAYTRVEPLINHLFIRNGWFTVRWQGWLSTQPGHNDGDGDSDSPGNDSDAAYTFHIWADDGCRLFIDDEEVTNSWIASSEDSEAAHRKATVVLAPGRHRIVIEYFQGQSLNADDADPMKLYWECLDRNIPRQIIPASHFSHTVDDLIPKPGRLD